MSPCRESTRTTKDGYGYCRADGKQWRTHRWVVAQIDGEDAIKGKVVMHECDNPACYRYDHLRIGSQADNMIDMASKGRACGQQNTHCKHGHEFDDENTYIKPNGNRACKICKRASTNAWRARRKELVSQ